MLGSAAAMRPVPGDDLRGHLFPGDEENHPAPDHDGVVAEALVETPQQRDIDRGRDGAGPGRILDQGEQPAVQVVELIVASTDLGGQFGIVRAQDPFGERPANSAATRPIRESNSSASPEATCSG